MLSGMHHLLSDRTDVSTFLVGPTEFFAGECGREYMRQSGFESRLASSARLASSLVNLCRRQIKFCDECGWNYMT